MSSREKSVFSNECTTDFAKPSTKITTIDAVLSAAFTGKLGVCVTRTPLDNELKQTPNCYQLNPSYF